MRYLSLFSGMEAAHLAWAPLGWECVAVAEIDPAACALLRHRLPGVPNLGSVTDITDDQIRALGRIDVLIGGSPCQDLSVAGRRAGLEGARSGLFHEQLRIFNAARLLCGARWLVWENVPGAFSSNQGRDFAVVVGAMAGSELPVPAGGWGSEGVALGDNGLVEWSVLDAQWFGVAQRRRRVFAVLDTGDWSDRPPVLLEPDRMRGDSAPRRGTREGVASTLTAGAGNSSGPGLRAECDGGSSLIPHTLGYGGGRTSGEVEVAACLTAKGMRIDFEVETFLVQPITHTLTANGFDGSEDGSDRGTPIIVAEVAGTLDANHSIKGQDSWTGKLVAFDCKAAGDTGLSIGEVPGTLRASHGSGHAAIAIDFRNGTLSPEGPTQTIQAAGLGDHRGGNPNAMPGLLSGLSVRRLTPRECERLQGFPDDYTLIAYRGRIRGLCPDGPRYKSLGNSKAVTVVRWIGQRLNRQLNHL